MHHIHSLELRRQGLHIFFGVVLIFLHMFGFLTNWILFGLFIAGLIISLAIKKKKMRFLEKFLLCFEREHHIEKFPGRGPLFFTLGCYLSLVLFEPYIAYAGIMVLTIGDAFSNLIGRHFGKIKTKLNRDKFIEGNVAGIFIALPFAYYFFPDFWAVLAASTVGMFLEIPHIKIFNFEIDDNLLIPLGASFTLSLFAR